MKRKTIVFTVCRALLLFILLLGTLFYTGVLWFNMPSRQEYPVWGVDVSNWQGEIDWPVLAAEGMDFAFIKATEGKGFTDARFAENWQGAREAGLLVGAYHFLTGSSTGAQQAAHFIATVPRQAGMLPPVIDIEVGVGLPGINDILDEMIAALEAHYGVPPILYVTHGTYDAFVADRYGQCPIWIRDVMKKPTLSDGRAWLLWQYSNRGRLDGYEGAEAFIDLNVFSGSREALEALAVAPAGPSAQSPSTLATMGAAADETPHDNPIDAYFLPRMDQAQSGIEHRQLQDEYGVAWKTEFYSILAWMKEKCSYPADIDRLDNYAAAVEDMIEAAHIVLVTDWLNDYALPPDDYDRYSWGNGTRSGLNKAMGDIYRNAGMSLIRFSDDYVFLEHDYAHLPYEDLSPWHKSDYCQPVAALEAQESLLAENGPRYEVYPEVVNVAQNKDFAAYIPHGFQLHYATCGDINGDGLEDALLILAAAGYENNWDDGAQQPLFILLGQPEGGYEVVQKLSAVTYMAARHHTTAVAGDGCIDIVHEGSGGAAYSYIEVARVAYDSDADDWLMGGYSWRHIYDYERAPGLELVAPLPGMTEMPLSEYQSNDRLPMPDATFFTNTADISVVWNQGIDGENWWQDYVVGVRPSADGQHYDGYVFSRYTYLDDEGTQLHATFRGDYPQAGLSIEVDAESFTFTIGEDVWQYNKDIGEFLLGGEYSWHDE